MARVVVPGVAHHITQRGVRRSPVFLDEDDRRVYAKLLLASCIRHEVQIRAYCWMTNHVHLVAVPIYPDSFARTFRRAHSQYAREFNHKHGLSGYLWQDRFYSSPMDDAHMWAAVRYVEQNPVRSGLVSRADAYPWSSARARCRGEVDPLLDPHWMPPLSGPEWAEWLAIPNAAAVEEQIRATTFSGVPCGDDAFVAQLEAFTGRTLRLRKPGPKNNSGTETEPRVRSPSPN